MTEPRTITGLLDRWRQGDGQAFDELLPLVYEELRQVAARQRGGDETLRPTALVHEAYLRLKGHAGQFEDRVHFFAAAATTMRRLLFLLFRLPRFHRFLLKVRQAFCRLGWSREQELASNFGF